MSVEEVEAHIKVSETLVLHLFKKALVEDVGVSMSGCLSLVVVLESFCNMKGKNTQDNLTFLLCMLQKRL